MWGLEIERVNIEIWPKLHELGQFFGKLGNFLKFIVFVCVCVCVCVCKGGSEYIEVPGKKSKPLD